MAELPRILVVDDEPAVQSALLRALTLERYHVAQAADGHGALQRLGLAPYEAVILDISMPTWMASRSAGACARRVTGRPC
jgi:two-component system, OmpR family, response regulator MprA